MNGSQGNRTITQAIAEQLFAEGHLEASFFCSRDSEDRSNLHFIFPSPSGWHANARLSISLCVSPPTESGCCTRAALQPDAEPLRKLGVSTVVNFDTPDECRNNEPSSAILSVLGRFVRAISQVKFFITGRADPRIRSGFRLPLLVDSTHVFVLHDVHPSFGRQPTSPVFTLPF